MFFKLQRITPTPLPAFSPPPLVALGVYNTVLSIDSGCMFASPPYDL